MDKTLNNSTGRNMVFKWEKNFFFTEIFIIRFRRALTQLDHTNTSSLNSNIIS